MWCFHEHHWPHGGAIDLEPNLWWLHRLIHHHPGLLRFLLWHAGFVDADEDGGIMYWRLDFWNSSWKRLVKELKAEKAAPHFSA